MTDYVSRPISIDAWRYPGGTKLPKDCVPEWVRPLIKVMFDGNPFSRSVFAIVSTGSPRLNDGDWVCRYRKYEMLGEPYTWVMPEGLFSDMFTFNLMPSRSKAGIKSLYDSLMAYDEDKDEYTVECNGFYLSGMTTLEAKHLAIEIGRSYFERPSYDDGSPVEFHDTVEVDGLASDRGVDGITYWADGTVELSCDGNIIPVDRGASIKHHDPEAEDQIDEVISSMSLYLDSDGPLDVAGWVGALSDYRHEHGRG